MKNSLEEFLSLVDVYDFKKRYSKDIDENSYFGFPLKNIIEAEKKLRSTENNSLAYISMEYGLANSVYNTFKVNMSFYFQIKNIFKVSHGLLHTNRTTHLRK